jgi:hypothetical protein
MLGKRSWITSTIAAAVMLAAQAATLTPFLNGAEYTATLGAFGGPDVTQGYEQNYHPASLSTSGVVYRWANGGPTAYTASASSTTSNAHNGSVSVSAQTQNFGAGAHAGILYYFTVVGPDADYVPITISGYGKAEASSLSGWAGADARFRVNYYDAFNHTNASVTENIANHEHRDFSNTINVKPNQSGRGSGSISLFAEAYAGTNSDFSPDGYYAGSAMAYIDPLFSIADPKLAKLYKIVLGIQTDSPTVPVATAPLPGSLIMMMTALGLLAGVTWLRRRGDGGHQTNHGLASRIFGGFAGQTA